MDKPVEFLVMNLNDGGHRVRLDRLTDGRIMCQLCFGYFHIADLNPVDGGVEDVCKPCAEVERLRGIDAHITHGLKYHTDGKCPRLVNGEMLHDWEGDDYGGGFLAGSYRIVTNVHDASMRGKLPCLHCVPVGERVFPPRYSETFGHEPTRGISLNSLCDDVCQRCTEPGVFYERGIDELTPVHIAWPCTSAVVLGLVAREEVTS